MSERSAAAPHRTQGAVALLRAAPHNAGVLAQVIKRPLGRMLAMTALVVTPACGLLIGLDDRPGRPAADASTSPPVDGSVDSGGASYCARVDASFCDDFDEPNAPAFARWKGFPPAQPYTVIGEAGLTVAPLDAAPSPPNALVAQADILDPDGRAQALLISRVVIPDVKAVELAFDLWVTELVSTGPLRDAGPYEGGNPDYDLEGEYQTAVAGVGTVVGGEPTGAFLIVTPQSLALAIGKDREVAVGGPELTYGRIAAVSLQEVGRFTWTRATILVGEASAVRRRAREVFGADPQCPAAVAVAVAGSDATFSSTKCVALADEVANIGRLPVLITMGASLLAPGRLRYRVDNVVVQRVF